MSGFISVIVWVVIMLAVSGVLRGKNRGGSSDQNPYYKNNTPPPGTAGLYTAAVSTSALPAACGERDTGHDRNTGENRDS